VIETKAPKGTEESDDGMIKINYFDERELLVRREIETKAPKGTEAKGTEVLPLQ